MRNVIFGLCTILIVILSHIACKHKQVDNMPSFDREAMLQNYANNLIMPAFNELQSKVNALEAACNQFVTTPNSTHLTNLQNAWDDAYTAWMYANAYNFGPAGEQGIKKAFVEEVGTWPTNTNSIENNILANNNTLNDFNRDNRGFNAIDYLIHDIDGDNTKILNAFNNPNRQSYLVALVAKLKSQVDEVVNAWKGSYRDEFIKNKGTDVGSSTAQLYNEFVKSYEAIKNFKLGIPLGKRVGQISTEPHTVEARYSGQSIKYLKVHFKAIEDIWYGRSKSGADGKGWKEYLSSVTGGTDLINRTETQLNTIHSILATIPETPSLEKQINSNFNALSNLHTELQKHTRNFKSDMSSLLGITITFSSGDGD